jgi:Tfp pilus assembly protein PilF
VPPPPVAPVEPRGATALVATGNRLLERGKAKEAQKLFEKALAEQPNHVEAMSGLAYCLLDTERYGAAADKFKQVLQLAPNNGDALLGLGQAYKMRGDKNRALEYYRKYIAELPSGSKVRMARANVEELEAAIQRAAPSETP